MRRLALAAGLLPLGAGLATAAAAPAARVELTFADPGIVESSGLVARDGLVVTVNDSGDTGRVFTVDRETGETVGVTTWSDDPVDVEAIAPAGERRPDEVWVGDIGDNAEERGSVSVTRVPVGAGDRDVRGAVTSYELRHPDGPSDAETLLVHPATGRLVVVTKGFFGGEVLVAPARLRSDRPNRLRRIGGARPVATDGAFWPDGRHLVVRSYSAATVYTWPALDVVARLSLPAQEQGEGVAVDEDGVVLLSSEGERSEVLRLRLPRAVASRLAPLPPRPTVEPTSEPSVEPTVAPSAEPTGSATDNGGGSAGDEPSPWPWAVGGAAALLVVAVLARRLRPRG